MTIAIILPHLKRFGGVRRFIELGNEFIKAGHHTTIYAGNTKGCVFQFNGDIKSWDEDINTDIVLCGDTSNWKSFRELKASTGKKFIYIIASAKNYVSRYKEALEYATPIVNNKKFLTEFPNAEIAEGGISDYWKSKTLNVLYHGRKGVHIEEQLADLASSGRITLMPLSGLDDNDLLTEYRKADYFVAWETSGGWNNMAAEAIASGVPVVTNGFNCEPFIDRCIVVKDLKEFFLDPMKEFRYSITASTLLEIFNKNICQVHLSNN